MLQPCPAIVRILSSTVCWPCWLMERGWEHRAAGKAVHSSPGPPTDICQQSWDTRAMGGALRNFPSIVPCMCGCCLPARMQQCPVLSLGITAGMVGPQPRRSPCCTTGCGREVLSGRAAELRWKKAAPLNKRAENGRQHPCFLLEMLMRCQGCPSSLMVQGPAVPLQTAWISSWTW